MASKIELSLIIPVFNEEKRLPKRFISAYDFLRKNFKQFEIIFVNDGSLDKSEKVLQGLVKKYPKIKLVSYSKNRGKGFAIKQGVIKAQGRIIGFTDADFAVDLVGVITAFESLKKGADIVIGDRNAQKSQLKNKPDFKRRFLGKVLGLINQIFLPLGDINDSQNGFKFFKAKVAKKIFAKVTIDRWLFDIQLLSLAKQKRYKIVQQPVLWQEIGESKVNILSDLPKVTFDLIKLYFQFMNVRFFGLLLSMLLIIILFPFIINPNSLTRRNGDFSDLVWPDYYFIKQSILVDHQIPFWNPTLFSGIPEIANPQSPLIYPPNILALFLPIDLAIVVLFFLHALLGGIFIFKLVRQKLNWSIISSVATSFTFVFSPFFWSKIAVGHLSQIFAIFLTAPIIYFGVSYLENRKWRYLFLTTLFLSMQYLNYPTIWYFTCLFGGLYLFSLFFKNQVQKTWLIFISSVLSLILIGPIFLIQLKAGPQITRSILSLNDLAIPIWSLSRFTKSIFIPSNFLFDNETEVWMYPSLIAILLACLGFFKLNQKLKLTAGLLLSVILLITLGGRTPVFGFLTRYFPGFSYLRVSTRDWFVAIIILAFLSGWGLEKMSQKFRKIIFGLLLLDLLFFSALRVWIVPDFIKPNNSLNLSSLFRPSNEYRTYCTSRCLSARDSLPAGVLTADGYHLLILQDYRLSLSQAGGFDPPEYTGNLPTYSVSGAQPSASKLGQFGVKWLISNHPLTDPNFQPQQNQNGYTLYQNTQAKPRFYFQNKPSNQLEVVKNSPNQIILNTWGEADTLIVADSFYPGWEGFIDQKQVTIKKQDGWARSVGVGEGKHQIEFDFKPFGDFFGNK